MLSIKKCVEDFFKAESSAHDFFHLERVEGIARYISKSERGNIDIIVASCYLHDIDRHLEALKGSHVSHKEAENTIIELLKKTHIKSDYFDSILEIVSYTREYSFTSQNRTKLKIEAQIVRDADNIDALGAIGIARSFVFGGKYNEPIWNPSFPVSDKLYEPGSYCPSVIHHYYEKLLRLKDDFDTRTGKQLAIERHIVIEDFLKKFFQEWDFAINQTIKI